MTTRSSQWKCSWDWLRARLAAEFKSPVAKDAPPMPLNGTRSPWFPLAAALLLGGCVGTAEINDYPPADDWQHAATISMQDDFRADMPAGERMVEARSDEGLEPEAEGLIIGPEVVSCYVGETLLLDLELTNPDLGELRPAALPEEASFDIWDGGVSVEWVPGLRDVGQHDFVFLVVDAQEPDLVLAHKTTVVSVLPRFSLVEYGF